MKLFNSRFIKKTAAATLAMSLALSSGIIPAVEQHRRKAHCNRRWFNAIPFQR